MYDTTNVFWKILEGDIPCTPIYETDHIFVFPDIAPKRKIHLLCIPKGKYTDFSDFTKNATKDEIQGFWKGVQDVIRSHNLEDQGYRIISNMGSQGGQEVPHFHIHILAGEPVGPLVA